MLDSLSFSPCFFLVLLLWLSLCNHSFQQTCCCLLEIGLITCLECRRQTDTATGQSDLRAQKHRNESVCLIKVCTSHASCTSIIHHVHTSHTTQNQSHATELIEGSTCTGVCQLRDEQLLFLFHFHQALLLRQ